MVEIAQVRAASTIQFAFREPTRLPAPLLKLDAADAGYGERRVLENVTLNLAPGDRIALLGANGAGKSTLVKLLAGGLEPLAGERIAAKDLAIGYFAQHQLEQLDSSVSAVAHLLRLDPALGEKAARDFLGGFGFAGDRALEPVAPFSGGEKARLCLALTVFQRPNLLLLDEPTNHLDLDMREALTEALNDFAGAVVLVAHDRALIRACCETLLQVGGGRVAAYAGDLDDYARQVMRAASGDSTPAANAASGDKRRDGRRARADERARLAPLRQEMQRLEKRMTKVEADKRQTETALADPALYGNAQSVQVQELTQRAAALAAELAELEVQWLSMHDELERVT
ncbi:MAG: ATP-binding cassette domain-containing protein [Xanthomonadaceae bacterium]|nr:ATP-binding cassette domain-containing protein [Xanthomonadaceae bacterium]